MKRPVLVDQIEDDDVKHVAVIGRLEMYSAVIGKFRTNILRERFRRS
jgi:hypothetical protein